MTFHHCFLLFLLLVMISTATAADAFCTISTPKGLIDLRPLGNRDYYISQSPVDFFYVNVCKNAVKSCNGADYPAVWFKQDSAECSGSLGNLGQTKLTFANGVDATNGLILEYAGGSRVTTYERRTKIELYCDMSLKDTPVTSLTMTYSDVSIEDSIFYYIFKLSSPYACPGFKKNTPAKKRRVVGVGGALLIIIPILAFVYMLVGSLIMKFKFEKSGTDVIIHGQYLKEVPKLIWEGVLFIYELVRTLVDKARGNNTQQYSELN